MDVVVTQSLIDFWRTLNEAKAVEEEEEREHRNIERPDTKRSVGL